MLVRYQIYDLQILSVSFLFTYLMEKFLILCSPIYLIFYFVICAFDIISEKPLTQAHKYRMSQKNIYTL